MATGRVPTTANSPLTAKGDLFGYSTTQARVAVGNDGETLVADSSASTGLRYTAGNPLPNPIINSCFDIWQRGTSATIGTNTYSADRWIAFRGAYASGMTISRQLVNDSTNLPNVQYCARIQRDSGNTSTQSMNLQYWQETSNSVILAGKTVTLSFYARAGANYSTSGNGLTFQLYTGTGTDQNGATVAYTGATAAINTSATLTTTWQRFSATATLATNTNEYGVLFVNTPTGTAGAADYYEVTGVQIDQGSVALPVRRNAATIQGELAACQRYYWRQTASNTQSSFGLGMSQSATVAANLVQHPVQMRTAPSSVDFSTLAISDGVNYLLSVSALTISTNQNSPLMTALDITNATGATAYRTSYLRANSSTSGYLGFSAEL